MKELLTARELSKYLKLNATTILRKAAKGEIPAIKIGRQFRFDKEKIDNWLSKQSLGKKLNILVVDDDPWICGLFTDNLQRYGYNVTSVLNGGEALNFLNNDSVDIIFLDILLQDINGAELYKKIREKDKKVPIVVITGFPDSAILNKVIEMEPLTVMKKPFNINDVLKIISNLVIK